MIRGHKDRFRKRRDGTPQPVADQARELAAKRRAVEAVDLLAAAEAEAPDPDLKILLRDLRHVAGVESRAQTPRAEWPPVYDDPFGDLDAAVPEITAGQLSPDIVGGSVASHGCLLVRNLFDAEQSTATLDSIKRAHDRMRRDGPPDEWYSRFDVVNDGDLQYRKRVESNGGAWLADSPRTTAQVLATLRSVGVVDAFAAHFGERPVFSLQKSTLRCMAPDPRITAWHQDGSFLDKSVRTMNVWVALTACGADHPASGLEIVPRRMTEYLPLAPEFAKAAASVEAVKEVMSETPSVRPQFLPGDALIFDERLLHRTYLGPGLTEDRYALECWFFAPSHATARYTPFLV